MAQKFAEHHFGQDILPVRELVAVGRLGRHMLEDANLTDTSDHAPFEIEQEFQAMAAELMRLMPDDFVPPYDTDTLTGYAD